MKWILENKLIILVVSSLIGGISYGGKLLNDASYQRGYYTACNEAIKQNNLDLERLILLEYKCKYNLCPGE